MPGRAAWHGRAAWQLAGGFLAALVLVSALLLPDLIVEMAVPPPAAPMPVLAPQHPIGLLPPPPVLDARRQALGERLFTDPRLSGDGTRACASCHDLQSNGATPNRVDTDPAGQPLPLNTVTVFNAALNFRLGWEGTTRTLEAHTEGLLQHPGVMNARIGTVVGRLAADPAMAAAFREAYRRPVDKAALLDALATFLRGLVTPGSRFDRWLAGEAGALTPEELAGYALFRSIGCAACHQGANAGGNLFQRHGIFHALAASNPRILRVPSLRNVGITAPYFHDGSAATLEEAVRGMGLAQLNTVLDEGQVSALVAFLHTLTGTYRGQPLGAPP